jgi:hypothetical protein
VTIKVRGIDRYGRTVGEVVLPDGSSLNREMVREDFGLMGKRTGGALVVSADGTVRTHEADFDPNRLKAMPHGEWR